MPRCRATRPTLRTDPRQHSPRDRRATGRLRHGRPHHTRTNRADPPRRARGHPTGRAGAGAGRDRGWQPDHRHLLQHRTPPEHAHPSPGFLRLLRLDRLRALQRRPDQPQVDVGNRIAGDSTLLETYGDPGPGHWITIYASTNHAFIQIAGIVLDTAHWTPTTPPGTGPRWQPASTLPQQLADGNTWTQRHPQGL